MLYAYVNYSKFGTPFGLPIDKQDILLQRPERRAALAASHSLFSLRYAPTNLLQYLRPDAIGFDRLFPWVTFSARPQIVGDVPFDNIEPSASIPAVSTLLFVLTVVGTVGAIRLPRPDAGRASAAALRVPLLATTLAAAGMFLAAVQFERYEGDVVPVLVIASAAGLFSLPTLLTGRGRNVRTLIAGALVALAAWSCLATFSLALQYQRAFSTFQTTPIRTGFVAFQLDVNDALGLPGPDIQRGSVLPHAAGKEERRTTAPLGTFFVLPYCAGVYLSNGKEWQPVEESLGDVPTPICNRLLGSRGELTSPGHDTGG
jgi:hypothetical protein